MRFVFGLVLLAGIALAGMAVFMAQAYIGETQRQLAEARAAAGNNVETTPVWTARRQMRFGERLAEEDVVAINWPKNAIPPNAITDRDELFGGAPRHVLRAMEVGEPLMPVKLTRPGEDAGITARLAPGKRAFTIDVNVTTGVAGFLRPTDRVDVYWTGRTQAGEVTRLLESGVTVIAVDQSADQDRTQSAVIARSVTVQASSQQVAALALAQSTGRLSLALVGVADDTVAQHVEIDQRRLLGIEPEAPQVEAPAPEVCTVRTRRGGEMVDIPIPCTN